MPTATFQKPAAKEYATPIGKRVLVRVRPQEQILKSGLVIAQTNPVLPIDGYVVAIGDSPKIEVKPGDRVAFGKFAGVEVKLNGADHIVMFEDEVLALVEKEKFDVDAFLSEVRWEPSKNKVKLDKVKENNDLGYVVIDAMRMEPIQDFIFCQWQLCQREMNAGGFLLARPEKYLKMHYVGNVLAVGPDVNPAITKGCRISFDQFSDIDKYWDQKLGRVALLKESRQGAMFMVISPRTKVEGAEPDYNYDV